jgi:hypothetical protein
MDFDTYMQREGVQPVRPPICHSPRQTRTRRRSRSRRQSFMMNPVPVSSETQQLSNQSVADTLEEFNEQIVKLENLYQKIYKRPVQMRDTIDKVNSNTLAFDQLYKLGKYREKLEDWDATVICYLAVLGKLQHRKGIFSNELFLDTIERLDRIVKNEELTSISYGWLLTYGDKNLYAQLYRGDYYQYGQYVPQSNQHALNCYMDVEEEWFNPLAQYKIAKLNDDKQWLSFAGINGYKKALHELADWFLEINDTDLAIEVYKYCKTPFAYKRLGDLCRFAHEYEEAIKMYTLSMTDCDAMIGRLHYVMGQPDKAIEYFQEDVLKENPKWHTYDILGKIYQENDNPTEAFRWKLKAYTAVQKKCDEPMSDEFSHVPAPLRKEPMQKKDFLQVLASLKKDITELLMLESVRENVFEKLDVNYKETQEMSTQTKRDIKDTEVIFL